MPRSLPRLVCLACGACLLTQHAWAEVRVPSVFGSRMVLQRDAPVPVWGWAAPAEEVRVTIRDQEQTVRAGDDGRWRVTLKPLALGTPATLTIKGTNTVQIDNVLIGEVWLCSGQSNMQFPVALAVDSDLELSARPNTQIRLYQVPPAHAEQPQTDIAARWEECSPETIGKFSAVAWFFGKQLKAALDVPVGLIDSSLGGSRADAWLAPAEADSNPAFEPLKEYWATRLAAADLRDSKEYKKAYPSNLYNGMIAPLVPFAIRGVIWYQGEANVPRAYQYRTMMLALIRSWRDAWREGDFPFYMVQLTNHLEPAELPQESEWAELREAQMLTTSAEKNTGVACAIDLGAAKDIHPMDKQTVAKRLARLALVDVYGFAGRIARSGPAYRSMRVEHDCCVLTFDPAGGNLTSWYGEQLRGFAIAGPDRKFVWAQAQIAGDTVVVSHPEVKHPIAVRYSWGHNPNGNLYNTALLPAYPFRTDDWDGVTKGRVTP
ncbi:MAG: sialate O-acetylesterase [Planctomycetaceae bacterium]